MTEIDYSLSQKKDTDIIEFVGTVLWNKAKEKKTFQNLSIEERNFVYIDIFESELNNEGLYGFFFNNSGEFSHEILEAFTAIKATENANIIYKALKIFPELPVPKDIMVRRQFMNQLQNSDLEKWAELELDLLDIEENLVDLIIQYIKLHKTSFEY